jgi:hypothetical protein
MDSCITKYNHPGYLTILYSIGFQPTSTSKDVNLALKDLLYQNLSSNPLIQKYITNIEKPNPTHGLFVFSSSVVEEIFAKISTSERPFQVWMWNLSFKICHYFLTYILEFLTILMMPLKLDN